MNETILSIKLKEYRKNNNLTQNDLAEKLDVSDKTISKWELGQTYPNKTNMLKLSKLLDISLEVLLLDEKSNDKYKLDFEELLYWAFFIFIITYTFATGTKKNIIIAIITSILFIFSKYLQYKNSDKF